VVDQLIEDNHLQGGDLQVGQAIDLPTPMH
jgi:hypothetical protein